MKKQEEPRNVRLGNLEIDLDILRKFLIKAKQRGYAGDGESEILRDYSKEFMYSDGNFFYTDDYCGNLQFFGTEKVTWQKPSGQPIWYMNYIGNIAPEFRDDETFVKKINSFLRESLFNLNSESPFRGAIREINLNCSEDFVYSTHYDGNLEKFNGQESIYYKIKTAYSGYYHGGIVIPKKSKLRQDIAL